MYGPMTEDLAEHYRDWPRAVEGGLWLAAMCRLGYFPAPGVMLREMTYPRGAA